MPRRYLILTDAFFVALSWFLAYFTRKLLNPVFGFQINELSPYLKGAPMMVASWILISLSLGLYRKEKRGRTDEIVRVLNLVLIGAAVSMSLGFLFRELNFGRSVIPLFSLYSFLSLSISRFILIKNTAKNTLIFGVGNLAFRVLQKLQDIPENYNVVGFVSENKEDVGHSIDGHTVLGTLSDLRDISIKKKVDEIIIASKDLPTDAIMDIIQKHEDLPVAFKTVVRGFESLSYGFPIEFVGDMPIVDFGIETKSQIYELSKRVFDFTLSLILLILILPILFLLSVIVIIDSGGNFLFLQERVGYKGKIFKIIKFRTMKKDAPKFELSPRTPDDPRITLVGRFLRKWSLDELPQIINILKGDMSFVGPRPEMPQIVDMYKPWQRKRLEAKPGLTGLWQVLGRKNLPLEQNIHYDLIYIKNRSFLLDLAIILKTIPVVFKRKGSY